MTIKEKENWLKNATDKELLQQLVEFNKANQYGVLTEDIRLTEAEILRRMK